MRVNIRDADLAVAEIENLNLLLDGLQERVSGWRDSRAPKVAVGTYRAAKSNGLSLGLLAVDKLGLLAVE